MRAQFVRGQEPKDSMEIGVDAKVSKFLEKISQDYQLDPGSQNYLGYINVWEDSFYSVEMKEGFEIFVNTWPRYKFLMDKFNLKLGINVEKPEIEETVFYPTFRTNQ